jgi:poly(hydroxyalkanoate) depolymerase family esterase
MRNLHSTITRLKAMRDSLPGLDEVRDDRLAPFSDFGSNPGALQALIYVPNDLPANAPLVVVLHGCTQTPGGYNRSSAWSEAAEEHGFALLFPEQQRANNPNLCFNWFSPEDAKRGQGEALSIRQMVAAMQERHGTDPSRTFVTGLSAGGAMTAVMLATYPEVFAGGAIIAGLPYGTAQSVPQAFDRMRGHSGASPDALAAIVKSATGHKGPWPTVSVWHGTSDATVDSSNARAIVDQWRAMHGVASAPSRTETVNGYPHRIWTNSDGRDVIEEYVITGMGHGTPLSEGERFGETPGPFMLDVGISSTRRIASFWGIGAVRPTEGRVPRASNKSEIGQSSRQPVQTEPSILEGASAGIQKTIEDALRTAGLIR